MRLSSFRRLAPAVKPAYTGVMGNQPICRGIALLLCLACTCLADAEKLRIGVFLHSPIVMQRKPGGEPYGPGIDYAKDVARALGYEADIQLQPIARILSNLKNGSLDIGLEFGMLDERKSFVLYSDAPCLTTRPSITVRADNRLISITSANDLAGMRVGYLLGAYAGTFFAARSNVEFDYVSGDSWVAQNFAKLLAGRIDAILDQNEYSCLAEARAQGVESKIRVIPLPGAPVKGYAVFSRTAPGAEALLRDYNAKMRSSIPDENALIRDYLDSIGRQ